MPSRRPPARGTPRIVLRAPVAGDAEAFLAAVRLSRRLHGPWAKAPSTRVEFDAWLARNGGNDATPSNAALVALRRDDGMPVGVLNFSNIVRGLFRSAYLGYYAFAPLAGQGYMTEAMALALDHAFRRLKLHRVEANVQPANRRSIALVRRVGFTREGYSRRYIRVAGRWRDHVRYAMLAEDWPACRRRLQAQR